MREITGEKISIFFHFQSISIAIQRSNPPNHLLVVAVKKSSIAQKLRIHSEMEEKNLTDVMKYLS